MIEIDEKAIEEVLAEVVEIRERMKSLEYFVGELLRIVVKINKEALDKEIDRISGSGLLDA